MLNKIKAKQAKEITAGYRNSILLHYCISQHTCSKQLSTIHIY